MNIALVIPSYGRPAQLACALASAHAQQRPFDEIVIVVRDTDAATLSLLTTEAVTVVRVSEPGVLAAIRAGIAATTGDLIAFTDDDAILDPTWSRRLVDEFSRPENRDVGAIGGRDRLFDNHVARATTLTTRVGRLSWWGRLEGNHHRGTGPARDVIVLKGVNAAYRREALAVPRGLRGSGAEAHFEVALGHYARTHGWRLRYDPDLSVEHHPAARLGEDQRQQPSEQAIADSAYNLMRALAPSHQNRRWLYVHLVGDAACPGMVRCAAALVQRDRAILARRAPSWRATTEAWRERHRELDFESFSPTKS